MIIMGIDPGLATTGYGIIQVLPGNQLSIVEYGCIITQKEQAFAKRLLDIHENLHRIIKKHNPDKVAIETIYFAKNVKTAMKVAEARGVATLAAAENKIKVYGFTPLQVKQALTGYGQASKKQIQQMVKIVLNLKKSPRPDDAADAIAIAITCAQTKEYL